MSRLPADSGLGAKMQQTFIDALYKDLPHPPTSFLGPVNNSAPSTAPVPEKPTYAFRPDDGSGYNATFPSLGMAGAPYARTVPAFSTVPASALPDPGLIFDLLLKRDNKEPFKPHPGGLSGMFFGVANLSVPKEVPVIRAS
jgi:linoleate 10R-lipoxygenase